MREAHCPECHRHFSSDSLAEKHRIKYRCMTTAEMLSAVTRGGSKIFRLTTDGKGREIWRYAETLKLRSAPEWMT